MRILVILFLLLLSACNGGDGSSEQSILNPLLFEGSGKWTLTYLDNGVSTDETLTFTGDECQFQKVYHFNYGDTEAFNKRLSLYPVGSRGVIGTNLADTDEQWTWSYSISGDTLRLCDETNDCFDFLKQL